MILRKARDVFIGGFVYQPIVHRLFAACSYLFSLAREQSLFCLAEIYAAIMAEDEFSDIRSSLTPHMLQLMQKWLRDDAFRASEEGMFTQVAMLMGRRIACQGIAHLTGRVPRGSPVLSTLTYYGKVEGRGAMWNARFVNNDPRFSGTTAVATIPELLQTLRQAI